MDNADARALGCEWAGRQRTRYAYTARENSARYTGRPLDTHAFSLSVGRLASSAGFATPQSSMSSRASTSAPGPQACSRRTWLGLGLGLGLGRVGIGVRVAVRARLAHRLGELEHVRLHEEPAARRDARGEGSRLASGER